MRSRTALVPATLLLTAASLHAQDSRFTFRCYDLSMSPWDGDDFDATGLYYVPPPRIMLDSVRQRPGIGSGSYVIRVTPGSVPSVHRYAVWHTKSAGDSIEFRWSTGHSGLTATLAAGPGTMTGQAETHVDVIPSPKATADFVAAPVDCDAPPAYPIESEPPVPDGVRLVSGDSVVLGENVADVRNLQVDGTRRYVISVALAAPFRDATSAKVSTSEGVVVRISVRLPPDWDFDAAVVLLSERYGEPKRGETTKDDLQMEYIAWQNRLATAYLSRSRRIGEDWYIHFLIVDPRA